MIRSVILCALFLGAANAARQIVVNPSPPPPGPSTADVPGLVFSVVVPGRSNADWTSADNTNFCSAMVNLTTGYEKSNVKCQVNAVTSTVNVVAAAVGGQMYWGYSTGATDADKTAALNSRNLLESQISLNQTLALNGFYGSNANDTCDSSWVGGVVGAASEQKLTAGMPGPASCRIAPLGLTPVEAYDATTKTCQRAGFTAVPVTSSSLCFTTASTSTANTVGIDTGRVCPAGANYITSGTSTEIDSISVDTIQIGAAVSGVQTVTVTTAAITGSDALSVGNSAISISGVTATDITGTVSGTGCTAASVTDLINGVHIVSAYSAGTSFAFEISASGCELTPGATGTTNMKYAGAWSPACDSSATFYNTYNSLSTSTTNGLNNLGRPCPSCATISSPSTASQWSFTGPNAGKFCSSNSMVGGSSGAAKPWYTPTTGAGMAGTSCVAIDVNDQGAGNALTGTPMLTAAIPYGTTTSAIFRTTSQSPVGTFSSNAVLAYNSANSKQIAIDSEFNVPCSTPKINRVGAVTGVINAGSCNTQSLWWNGGTGVTAGQNGIPSDTETFGILKSTFLAPFVGPTPAPAPSPTPTPSPVTPSPKPPTPSPSPPSLVCTYKGSYEVRPLYTPCSKYFLASGTADDCSNNIVSLRTKAQLGKKFARIRWAFATVAEKGLSTPTNFLAEARVSAKGTCTNRFLAAPSDPTTLKVGGSSWKWQVVPYPGSEKCDHVNLISQNRLSTTAFLEVPRTCDRFRYNATDGGRQRFVVVKV